MKLSLGWLSDSKYQDATTLGNRMVIAEMDDLDSLPPIYFPSDENIDESLFSPISQKSTSMDCMVGYFASSYFSELPFAISSYLNISSSKKMRFLVSPNFQAGDLAALENAYASDEDFFEILFPHAIIEASTLKKYSVKALAYLVLTERVELRVAIKSEGIFHAKCWLFTTAKGEIAVHGSSNATAGGMVKNFEQLALNRSWLSEESRQVCSSLKAKFDQIWDGKQDGIHTLTLNNETIKSIRRYVSVTEFDLEKCKKELRQVIIDEPSEHTPFRSSELVVPEFINYKSGEFKHQGDAVAAWFSSGCNGIFSIATGGGKTYTSLIAASKLLELHSAILVIISVPTKALMTQWCGDVREFGVEAVDTNGKSQAWISRSLKEQQRNLRLGVSKVEVMVVTHQALISGRFDNLGVGGSYRSLLIADEVHNLGSENSQINIPKMFDFKIGLSATFERQFDPVGTEFLASYFGGVVYEYDLKAAIGSCLVKFDYYAHFVFLTAEEEDEFQELTYEIKKVSYAANDSEGAAKEKWQRLCLRRRALTESAQNKVDKLFSVMPATPDSVKKTLIFCTDKNPSQLIGVNQRLRKLGVRFHQVTADETANNKSLQSVITSFAENELQVLTSKRVLDEGFNVPQTETAYILASNTVIRQWTQRLGRVLRTSKKTGKTHATIHDFIVLPIVDGEADDDLKGLLESEYRRVQFFSEYSSNLMHPIGGYYASKRLLNLLGAV
jgi:superfamily II DNA or RNA helicase